MLQITGVSGRTGALHSVVVDVTFRETSARVSRARVLAKVVDAGGRGRAVRVAATAQKNARNLGIASVARWADAYCLVIDTHALCSSSANALGRCARGHAIVIDARVGPAALAVGSASDHCEIHKLRVKKSEDFLVSFPQVMSMVSSH